MKKRYLLRSDETVGLPELVDLDELLSANQDDEEFCLGLMGLEPGQTYYGGGGAAPEFSVECVEEDDDGLTTAERRGQSAETDPAKRAVLLTDLEALRSRSGA